MRFSKLPPENTLVIVFSSAWIPLLILVQKKKEKEAWCHHIKVNPEIEFIWIKGGWEQKLKEGKGELNGDRKVCCGL